MTIAPTIILNTDVALYSTSHLRKGSKTCTCRRSPGRTGLSLICPTCDGDSTRHSSAALLWVTVAIVFSSFIFVLIGIVEDWNPEKLGWTSNNAPEPAPPAKAVPKKFVPLPGLSLGFANADAALQEAVRRFPDLGKAGTRFNQTYVEKYRKYKAAAPDYFSDTSWPLRLASEVASNGAGL